MSKTTGKKRGTTPPITAKDYESKLILLAMRQTEHQLKNMTATSQIVSHYLALASKQEEVKLKKLQLESELLEARIKSEQANQNVEEMFEEVLSALKSYGVNHDH